MIQFLSNIWNALNSQNIELVNILLIPATFIEHYLFMQVFLNLFNVNASTKEKSIYVVINSIVSIISQAYIQSPFNVILNYTCILILIYKLFKLNIVKSLFSLFVPSFIFGLLNTLLQNTYLTIFNINSNVFISTPIYRVLYLSILYFCMFVVIITIKQLKKFKKLNFDLSQLDALDKSTSRLLIINIFTGFVTICTQLITTAFYINIVPLTISILNFILLVAFLTLSCHSFFRIIKLANTTKSLECAEDYTKSLEILYDKVKGYKHDFDNIVSTLDGFIETDDMPGLKRYFKEVKADCKITNNLSLVNPHIINNPGIYSLLNNKYFKAANLGINFDLEFFLNLDTLNVNMYKFSRAIGILLDNAIEEAEKCDEKVVKVSFLRENKNNRAVITVKNTYRNKDVDIEKIFQKGESGKENHSGIGLWEIRNYVRKSNNLDLFTSKDEHFFKQELSIYDL